jgi:phospholipid/cholesterol/gamma-HCH transport system substrate-binding protein
VESRVSYALVGLFVVVLTGALAGFATWLAAGRDAKLHDTYVAYMTESVSGLNVKAAVKYRGVDVGYVHEIALDRDNPERVRLLLDIERGTPIKVDTVAVLATQGITGLAYVDLTGGRRDAQALTPTPDGPYPEIRTAPSLLVRIDTAVTTLLAQMGDATGDLARVADRITVLLGPENLGAVSGMLAHLERVSAVLAERVVDLGEGVRDGRIVLSNWARASEHLPDLVSRLATGAAALNEAVSGIGRAAGGVDRMVGETRRDLVRASGDTMVQLQALLAELQGLTRTVQRLAGELEREPTMLIFGRRGRERGPGE